MHETNYVIFLEADKKSWVHPEPILLKEKNLLEKKIIVAHLGFH